MPNFQSLPPLSLYIHIPWCIKKCPYCDFNSHELNGDIQEQIYVEALLRDLDNDLARVWGRRLISIFIGGGTPSLLSPEAYEQLFSGIRARIPFIHDMEITLEANPGAIDSARFAEYRHLGINRLSIGMQSLNDRFLASLGRIHDSRQAYLALDTARHAGFENINLDMMFGLPGQTLSDAEQDLAQLIRLEPQHISYYQLTIEPNTYFHHAPPTTADDEQLADMQAQGVDLLAAAGYQRYEVSAYAQGHHNCRHNRNYWQFGDYLGIGAGAQGKISRADLQSITRIAKYRSPKDYLACLDSGSPFISSETTLTDDDVILEFALNSLRQTDGFTTAQFETHSGLPLSRIRPKIDQAKSQGLLVEHDGSIFPSEQGYLFLNNLIETFID